MEIQKILNIPPGNPHDGLFRSQFKRPEILREFLELVLPDKLKKLIDLDSLSIEPGSYLDENLKAHFSDLSASVRLNGRKSRLYILLEHKSYRDPMVMLQLLRYMVVKWSDDMRKNRRRKTKLCPILPILFYHGKSKNPSNRFGEMFGEDFPKNLQCYLPDFKAFLYNLTAAAENNIEANADLASILISLKLGRFGWDKILEGLTRLTDKKGKVIFETEGFRSSLVYLFQLAGKTPREIKRLITSVKRSPEMEEQLMTTAQMLMNEGMEIGRKEGKEEGKEEGKKEGRKEGWKEGKKEGKKEGRKEGRNEGIQKTVAGMKKVGIPMDMIKKATGLSEEVIGQY